MQNAIIVSKLRRGGLDRAGGLFHALGLSRHSAFTLAEVLITLGIIGVVAALTLPQVVTNYEKKATEVRLKKDYSTLANALKMAEAEHGPIETWADENDNMDNIYQEYFKKMEPYIQFAVKPCFDGSKCFPKNPGMYKNGVYFRLKDGTYGLFMPNSGYSIPTNPKFYFYLITNEKREVYGRTVFEYSIMNLKNLKIKSNVTCGTPICYWSTPPKCYDSTAVWTEYECSMKFAQDGFTFKDDYNFEKLNKTQSNRVFENMLKTKPKGWW